ncbi:MAG: 3-dehydroquinate synthase [Candidatus Hydrogenedens sp.]
MMSNSTKLKTIWIKLSGHSYPIHVGVGILPQLSEELVRLNWKGKIGIITDTNVANYYLNICEELVKKVCPQGYVIHILPAGEEYKTIQQIEDMCTTMLQGGLDRSSGIIALGGGVVGDIAGYFSASYMRGIPFIQVPTTIVSQVDASIGGKTGVNHPLGKNILGAFYQPHSVVIDLNLLKTLPEQIYREGFAEIIKHGVIADKELFDYCQNNAEQLIQKDLDCLLYPIVRSCEIKADIVMKDEKEQNIRAYLNYGHTFGHAFEAVTHYKIFLHGEAVSLGMVTASEVGVLLGYVPEDVPLQHRKVLKKYRLPIRWDDLPIDDVMESMKRDKKTKAGKLRFIIPRRIGEVSIESDVPEDIIRCALKRIKTD